jgi:hypothetical protein
MTDDKPLYVTNPEKWLHELVKGNDFVGIVIFRGSWCKFDRHYLHKLGKYNKDKMQNEGLKLIAWTSEGPEGAKKADEEWGLTKDYSFSEVIGDETNALAKYLVEDVILEHLVTSTPEEAKVQDRITPGTYPNGLVQPGMIWYAHHGSLVLQWEAKVEEPHFGGPNRPVPQGQLIPVNDFFSSVHCSNPRSNNVLRRHRYLGASNKAKACTGQGRRHHARSWKYAQAMHISNGRELCYHVNSTWQLKASADLMWAVCLSRDKQKVERSPRSLLKVNFFCR